MAELPYKRAIAKRAKHRKEKEKKKRKRDVEIEFSRPTKGRGVGVTVTPVKERGRRPSAGKARRTPRAVAEHRLEFRLENVTPLAKRVDAGTRLTVVNSGRGLVFVSPRGVLGLAPPEASETIRAALAGVPGAELESRVASVDEPGVRVRVRVLGASAAPRPAEVPEAAASLVAAAAASRRDR